ncbi:MAG: hypothetical protein ACOX75_05180 [Lachnospiraceae bacterium]
MTNKDLRNLNRKDLLQMLIEQSQEVQELRKKLAATEAALEDKTIAIDNAGSIADAALQLNDIFQVSQDACRLYMDNVRQLCDRQKEKCARMEEESRAKAKSIVEEAEKQKLEMERETKANCARMKREAREQSQEHWDEVSYRLEKFIEERDALRELLSIVPSLKHRE